MTTLPRTPNTSDVPRRKPPTPYQRRVLEACSATWPSTLEEMATHLHGDGKPRRSITTTLVRALDSLVTDGLVIAFAEPPTWWVECNGWMLARSNPLRWGVRYQTPETAAEMRASHRRSVLNGWERHYWTTDGEYHRRKLRLRP